MGSETTLLSNAGYEQTLAFTQKELEKLPPRGLKGWCEQHKLNYHTVVGLKNNTLNYPAFHLVDEILTVLGYKVTMVKYTMQIGRGEKPKTTASYTVTKPNP